ncbi:unannotated protein [freshwater metagenome]|uniref:Unannotated protein n=1 Tax=freshwater metagenome TaxID=449393 RepID=A0A6J7RZM8_9ZZZZ
MGVKTQVAPINNPGSLPARPSLSDPAIGCPPTNLNARSGRSDSMASMIGAFTEPTSVTTGAPASRDSIAISAIKPTGAAITKMSTIAAKSTTEGTVESSAPKDWASSNRSGLLSKPRTLTPVSRSARPIEPPISPTPTIPTVFTREDRLEGREHLLNKRGEAQRDFDRCNNAKVLLSPISFRVQWLTLEHK